MKKALIIFALTMAVGLGGILLAYVNQTPVRPDPVSVNDAVMNAMQRGSQDEAVELLTRQLLREYESMDAARNSRDGALLIYLCAVMSFIATAGLCFWLYCERRVLAPFKS